MEETEPADAASASAPKGKTPVPANMANIRFLCVDGRSRELQFPVGTRISAIKQELHKTWPDGRRAGVCVSVRR